jgi:hypothetical protein
MVNPAGNADMVTFTWSTTSPPFSTRMRTKQLELGCIRLHPSTKNLDIENAKAYAHWPW